MATNGWNKYNRFKAIGGISKKGREKGQREVVDLIKADDQHNFETVTKQLDKVLEELKSISVRVTEIEKKVGIRQIQ